jgi:hypothetical protein
LLQFERPAERADVRQQGRRSRPGVVTGRASTLALKDRFSSRYIPRRYLRSVSSSDAAQVGHDHPRFECRVVTRRHRCVSNSFDDDSLELLVGAGAFELAAQKGHATDRVSLRAVARRTAGHKESRSVFDIGLSPLRRVPATGKRGHRSCDEQNKDSRRDHGTLLDAIGFANPSRKPEIIDATRTRTRELGIPCQSQTTTDDLIGCRC